MGVESRYGLLVRLVWLEPSTRITYISRLPSRSEVKAIIESPGVPASSDPHWLANSMANAVISANIAMREFSLSAVT